jgi:hypothetical protein
VSTTSHSLRDFVTKFLCWNVSLQVDLVAAVHIADRV